MRTFTHIKMTWSEEVCRHDSDGDGLTNGQELGDPDCVWSLGDTPNVTDVRLLSHPGVCTPWNSPGCQATTNNEDWVIRECEDKGFVCPALQQTDVTEIPLRIPSTPVPLKTTTYMCMEYVLPSDGVYHMVATTPIVNNTNVLHHMLLFGCFENQDTYKPPGEAYECGMSPNRNCQNIIAMWGFGMSGVCLHDKTGVRIGMEGYARVALQLHWNNPFGRSGWSDASGMNLHVTRTLKPFDTGVWLLGSDSFSIPPQMTSHAIHGTCSSYCSNKYLADSIFITGAILHMHYLGKSMKVEMVRDGQKLTIAEDVKYNYDNPYLHEFPDPIEIKPGDELLTTCEFTSVSRNTTTFFGDATDDEMCFSFLTIYPLSNLRRSMCKSWESIPTCEINDRRTYQGCNLSELLGPKNGRGGTMVHTIFERLAGRCATDMCKVDSCIPLVRELRTNPCFVGDTYDLAISFYMRRFEETKQFHQMFTSCDDVIDEETKGNNCDSLTCSATTPLVSIISAVLCIVCFLICDV